MLKREDVRVLIAAEMPMLVRQEKRVAVIDAITDAILALLPSPEQIGRAAVMVVSERCSRILTRKTLNFSELGLAILEELRSQEPSPREVSGIGSRKEKKP